MMKIRYLTLSCLAALASVSTAQASNFENTFYGEAQGQMIWQSGKDFQTEAQLAKAGASGLYKMDNLTVKYDIEAQYSDNFSDRGLNDLEVNIARVLLISKYGVLVVGDGYSGVYSDIYKRVDVHQSNNNELASRNKMLWEQAAYASNILAYATPSLKIGSGKAKFVTSIVTPKDDNGTHDDVLTARLVYNSANFNTSAAVVRVNKAFPAVERENHYLRYSVGADYSVNNLTFAAMAEVNNHAFNLAENTYVGAIKYRFDDVDFAASYQHKTYEDEKTDDTQSLFIASVNYHYSDALSFFVEGAIYGDEPETFGDEYSENSLNLGLRFRI